MSRSDIGDLSSAVGLNNWIDRHPVVGCALAQKVLGKPVVNCIAECPFSRCVADCTERTEKRILAKINTGQLCMEKISI